MDIGLLMFQGLNLRLSSTFVQAASLTLNNVDDYPAGPVIANGNLYYGVWDSSQTSAATEYASASIVKINLSTFTRTTSISAPSALFTSGATDGTYAYFGTNSGNKDTYDYIVRLTLSDNTVKNLSLNIGEYNVYSIFTNGGYGYFSLGNYPGSVAIATLSSFTRYGSFQFKTTTNLGGAIADSSYLYFSSTLTSTSYGYVSKIDRSTLSLIDVLGLNYMESNIKAAFIDGTNAYFAAKTPTVTNPSTIVKVDLNTFTRTSALTLSAPNVNSVVKVGDYAYYGSSTNPGRITKMQISTFSEISTISLNATTAGQVVKNMDVALSDGTYGYFGSGGDSPGKAIKFDLATLNIITVTTFGTGVTFVRSGVIYGSYAFYGTQSGHVVQIKLSDLSIVATTALTTGTTNVNNANVLGSYIYFSNLGAASLNTTFFKYDPSANTYDSYLSSINSLVPSYNDGSGNIYYGTNTYPAYIYQVLVDTSCPSAVGGTLTSGNSRNVYSASSSCDITCSAVQGSITCTNGVLSGDTSFQYSSCTPSNTYTCGCKSAVGGELTSGNSRNVYSASTSCDTSCSGVQGSILCTAGVLSGDTTFSYTSCTPSNTYTCGCKSAVGGELTSGNSRSVYSASSSCNITCDDVEGSILCTAGVLSGDTSFEFASCTPSETYTCGCIEAVGGELMSGDYRSVYSDTSSCNITCDGIEGSILCTDGILSGDTSFEYVNCTPSDTYTCGCTDAVGGELTSGNSRDVYSASTHCSTSCDPVKGTIVCTDGILSGQTSFTFTSCTPSLTDTCGESQTSGDPHFYGFRGQKYDIMGQSFEIYNIITSPYMQINARFTPYFKTWNQIVPTGTMMGELGVRLNNHRFHVAANETTAALDGVLLSMKESWSIPLGNVIISNDAKKGNMYEIIVETKDLSIAFIRKVYTVAGLEKQWHYDYRAKLISDGSELHGLLGQSWEEKHFEEKSGTAFQFLDGSEDDYRIKSQNIFGSDFVYNKFVNF